MKIYFLMVFEVEEDGILVEKVLVFVLLLRWKYGFDFVC